MASKNAGKDKNVAGEEAPKASKSKVVVVNVVRDDEIVRTYSKAEHGADFRALAEEFASKVEGRSVVDVKAAKVADVEEDETTEDDE